MGSLPILWIDARTYCHATEDEARVRQALDAVLEGDSPRRETLEGHFGNPIVLLSRRTGERRAIATAWERWSASGLRRGLVPDLRSRLDEGVLHFRLDKQAAYGGTLTLAHDADTIDVRVRLSAYPASDATFLDAARVLLGDEARS